MTVPWVEYEYSTVREPELFQEGCTQQWSRSSTIIQALGKFLYPSQEFPSFLYPSQEYITYDHVPAGSYEARTLR